MMVCAVCCNTGCPQSLSTGAAGFFAPMLNGPVLPYFLSFFFYLFLQYLLFLLAPMSRTLPSFLLCFLICFIYWENQISRFAESCLT